MKEHAGDPSPHNPTVTVFLHYSLNYIPYRTTRKSVASTHALHSRSELIISILQYSLTTLTNGCNDCYTSETRLNACFMIIILLCLLRGGKMHAYTLNF